MATVNYSPAVLTIETATAGTSLNALTTTSFATAGTAIDNRPTSGTTVSADTMDIAIHLSSAVTTGAASPSWTAFILPAVDGTNYPAHATCYSYNFQFDASTSLQDFELIGIPIPPYQYKVQLQNNLGVTLPATNTSTAQSVRRYEQSW